MPDANHSIPPADSQAVLPRRPAVRRVLAAAVVSVAVATGVAVLVLPDTTALAALAGKPGVVVTNDGKRLEGDVIEDGDQITVSVNGIVTTVPRGSVRSIEYGTPEERLREKLDALPEADNAGRVAVAREALGQGLLDFAQQAAEDVLRRDPGNTSANAVLDNVSRQRRIDRSRGTGIRPSAPPEQPAPEVEGEGRASRRPVVAGEGSTLDEEQVNLIRQAELQPADATARQKPRIQFRDDVIRRFGESQKNFDFRPFNALPDVDKALAIFAGGDPEMRADVRVAGDPNAVLEYLRTVEPFVLNGCATSGCHGGTGAGDFVLYRVPAGEATSYTNFYALNAYTVAVPDPAGGAFGGGNLTRRMIDRAKPDDSLLLNYMLPAARAKYAHPKVDGYVSVVEDPANANFRAVGNWIGSVLPKTGGPQAYGFEFDMTGGRPDDRTRRRRGVAATRGESWRSVLPTVSPTLIFVLVAVLTLVAVMWSLVTRRRHCRRLSLMADERGCAYWPRPDAALARRLGPKLPVIGAAAVRVCDVFECPAGAGGESRRVARVDYSLGSVRHRRNNTRVVAFHVAPDGGVSDVRVAPTGLPQNDQFESLLPEKSETAAG